MWTPDVYEGAPTPVTAFFAAAPKVAAMALFVRAMLESRSRASSPQWQQVVVFISIASMVLAPFAAIGQTQHQAADGLFLDRPYGLRAGRPCRRYGRGVRGVLIYADLPVAMTLGTFAMHPGDAPQRPGGVEKISDFAGLSRTNPLHGLHLRDLAVLAGRHAAARGLLR
jgi:NADH-quinone oxidoreductase subunit N